MWGTELRVVAGVLEMRRRDEAETTDRYCAAGPAASGAARATGTSRPGATDGSAAGAVRRACASCTT